MKFFASLAALVALVPALVNALTVNTITTGVTECEPVLFTWGGGTAPYYLSLVPGTSTSSAPIKNFGEQQGTQYTWNVDLASGTSFTTVIKDSTGATAFSDLETVSAGTNSSCVNNAVSESSGSQTAGASAATTGGAAATTAAGSTAAAPSGSASSGSSKPSSAGSGASPSSTGTNSGASSGAGRTSVGAYGVAAVMGLVGAALL